MVDGPKKGAKPKAAVKAVAPAKQAAEGQQQMQIAVSPELDYAYRDFFSIFVGAEEVVLELGNRHRAQAYHASVQTRIVLSIHTAFRLQQALGRSLNEASKRIQEAREEAARNEEVAKQAGAAGNGAKP